jgi:hypothetical protein
LLLDQARCVLAELPDGNDAAAAEDDGWELADAR